MTFPISHSGTHRFVWIAWSCAWLVLAFAPDGRADINLPTAPPPQPLAQTVQVRVGGTVDIPLRGVSRSGQQLSFLIRTRPQRGSLSGVTVTDRHSGVVRYRHNPDLGAGVDRFRYAVQVSGSGVSTPAEVVIRVVDQPPRFEAPAEVDFQSVATGKTRTKVITLRNDGGGVIAGRMELPEPWISTDGDGTYRLAGGESTEIAITFAPQSVGRFSAEAGFSHSATRRLRLTGEAFFPLEITPSSLAFDISADGRQREATMRIKNRTTELRQVDINAPTELGGPLDVTIDGLAEIEIPLRTIPEFLAPLEGTIGVVNDGVETVVPFRLFAAPAKLIVTGNGDFVDFGTSLQGRSAKQSITVKNVGGADARLRGELPPDISSSPFLGGEALPPGEERSFELTFVGSDPGNYESTITMSDAEGSAVTWTLRAVVEADTRLSAAPRAPRPASSPDQNNQPATMQPAPRRLDVAFPSIDEIRLVQRSKHEIRVEWDTPSQQITRYETLERQFKFQGKGNAKIVWLPVKNTTIDIGPKTTSMTIGKLRPGQRITLAIIGFDSTGRQTAPSLPFIFDSEHSKPIQIPWMLIGGIIFVLCIIILRRERKRQKLELDQEFERINRWR